MWKRLQIMSLFERTPLGIKPGHFFAWMRLASWAQQGQVPSKGLLFTQSELLADGLYPGLVADTRDALSYPCENAIIAETLGTRNRAAGVDADAAANDCRIEFNG